MKRRNSIFKGTIIGTVFSSVVETVGGFLSNASNPLVTAFAIGALMGIALCAAAIITLVRIRKQTKTLSVWKG